MDYWELGLKVKFNDWDPSLKILLCYCGRTLSRRTTTKRRRLDPLQRLFEGSRILFIVCCCLSGRGLPVSISHPKNTWGDGDKEEEEWVRTRVRVIREGRTREKSRGGTTRGTRNRVDHPCKTATLTFFRSSKGTTSVGDRD